MAGLDPRLVYGPIRPGLWPYTAWSMALYGLVQYYRYYTVDGYTAVQATPRGSMLHCLPQ